jgi:hypothetical protein
MNAWSERVFCQISCCRLRSWNFCKIGAFFISLLSPIRSLVKSYVGSDTSISQHAYEHVCEHNRLPTRFRINMNTSVVGYDGANTGVVGR